MTLPVIIKYPAGEFPCLCERERERVGGGEVPQIYTLTN
jgi:hypothetical protein